MEGNFEKSIGGLVGSKIGFYLNDNQFIEGVLLNVKRDHLIVKVNQSVIYFALNQIHACSKNAKDFRVSSNVVPYLNRNNLTDILNDLKYNWVTINCMSNQTFAGLLSRICEDHIILVNNTEQLFVQKSYISNIYKGIYENIEQNQKNNVIKDTIQSLSPEDESNQLLEHESILPSTSESTLSSEVDSILTSTPEPTLSSETDLILPSTSESTLSSETNPVTTLPDSVQLPIPNKTVQFNEFDSRNESTHHLVEPTKNEQKNKNKMSAQEYFNAIKRKNYNDETNHLDIQNSNEAGSTTQNTYVHSSNVEEYDNESNNLTKEDLNTFIMNRNRKIRKRKFKLTKSNVYQKGKKDITFSIASLTDKKLLDKPNMLNEDYEVFYDNPNSSNHYTDPLFSNSFDLSTQKVLKEGDIDENLHHSTNNLDYKQSSSNCHIVNKTSSKEEKIVLEKQYYALMKHAEKMYLQLKNARLKKEH